MACFYPRQALRLESTTKSGKSNIRFISNLQAYNQIGNPNLLTGLPCGQCTGCRLERSRQWAIRCMNEAQLHEDNCFITLTFDDDNLIKRERPLSLDKSEFPLFFKRLRKKFVPKCPYPKNTPEYVDWFKEHGIRYYMCGEYGTNFGRPHYHAILFNFDFKDKVLEKVDNGFRYYSSPTLSELWPYGYNLITDVSFDTCAYVARYIMDKKLGKDAASYYSNRQVIPEYTTMSRRSGIGKEWLDKYLQDVYPNDQIFMRGKGFSKPPKYYDSLYEVVDPIGYESIKKSRIESALSKASDNTPERLHAKQAVKLAQIANLKRILE